MKFILNEKLKAQAGLIMEAAQFILATEEVDSPPEDRVALIKMCVLSIETHSIELGACLAEVLPIMSSTASCKR